MNDKKALEIFEECVNEMYENSTPPITWNDVQSKAIEFEPNKFTIQGEIRKHKLSEEKYDEIKAKYEKKLDTYYRRQLAWFLLDYSPTFKEEKK